jgi:integrase
MRPTTHGINEMQTAKLRRKNMLPHVEGWADRHGKMRYYFRRGKGARTPLAGTLNSAEFTASYMAALNGLAATARPQIEQPSRFTIAALITSYKGSKLYKDLRSTSKAGYCSRLNAMTRDFGECSVKGLNRTRIIDILDDYDDRPGSKLDTHKKLKILIKHAIDEKWIDGDPTTGIKRPKGGTIRAWTDDEIEQFEKRWALGSKQRTAFALMLYTGQRRSDTHRMTWTDISQRTGRIKVHQQKTDVKLEIPLHEELLYVLDKARSNHITIINTEFGAPFTVDGFSDFMRDAITAAGLPLSCQPHGLRKAAGRRLAEAGCTNKEIMAILGHKALASVQLYTEEAEQIEMAAAAMRKVEQIHNRPSPNRPFEFGNLPKRLGSSNG